MFGCSDVGIQANCADLRGRRRLATVRLTRSDDRQVLFSHVRETRASVSVNDSSGSDFDTATDQNDSPLIATAFASTALSSAASNSTQTTQFGNTLNWSGFGTANSVVSTPGTGNVFARSAFLVIFDVFAPLEYAFRGNFNADSSPNGGTGPNRGVSTWGFELKRAGQPVFSGMEPVPPLGRSWACSSLPATPRT